MKRVIFQRLKRIDHLIQIKGTGTPAELAEKVGISERSIYEYVGLMKDFGAPIDYSRLRKSYYYKEEGQFTIGFQRI
ncbi:MAG TPA: HTH domain-containing protein [Puia sp.]|nr:HTH domain-containing protein [Puia sp.]